MGLDPELVSEHKKEPLCLLKVVNRNAPLVRAKSNTPLDGSIKGTLGVQQCFNVFVFQLEYFEGN